MFFFFLERFSALNSGNPTWHGPVTLPDHVVHADDQTAGHPATGGGCRRNPRACGEDDGGVPGGGSALQERGGGAEADGGEADCESRSIAWQTHGRFVAK